MAIETHVKRPARSVITHSLHTMTGGEAFVTASIPLVDTDLNGPWAHRLFYRVKMNATTPDPDGVLRIYALFGDGDSHIDGGVTGSATVIDDLDEIAAIESGGTLLKEITIPESASTEFIGSVLVPLDAGGEVVYAFVLYSNASPSSTAGDHYIRYAPAYHASI